jgi:transposase-like protein
VQHRNAQTLLPVIQQYILPGTTVMSDLWAAYNTVANLGYTHFTVNHQVHFVDPVSWATTNHIESLWQKAKSRNKRQYGTHRAMLKSYLIEFMWRAEFGDRPFVNIIDHIKHCYPL